MSTIRNLFQATRRLDRRIEKVISFDNAAEEQLKREITEYVVTESIESSFERLLNCFDQGMGGGSQEIGIWVSGFYGSGKSSFTKYLGFALDPTRTVDGRLFLEWLEDQLVSKPLRAQLRTLANRYPSTVIMIDLASAQIAGATMAEISSVLYWTVMKWAGYPKDRKLAYLQLMLERGGQMAEFEKRIIAKAKGKAWSDILNQPLVAQEFASALASEFYPDVFKTPKDFKDLKVDDVQFENERVREMLELIRRKSGRENIIFILDEVGQYVAARDNLILNLDGLAKNIKLLGSGKAWLVATAQQMLTEDDPRAQMNTGKLFKLKDRFPICVELEASDIREICYRRLLTKSPEGEKALAIQFDTQGQSLRNHTQLSGTRFFKSDLDKTAFCNLYPFLPQHFDILLALLGRLAKTSGGVGLRSAIKVIQDVLVDQSGLRSSQTLLADQPAGTLATTAVFYDTLRHDIRKSFRHVVEGVERVERIYEADSIHARVAKSVAVLQLLDDFPTNRENIAALLHHSADAGSQAAMVKATVDEMLAEKEVHLSEIDGRLRFMSEAVSEMEGERAKINAGPRELRLVLHDKLKQIFTPAPTVRLLSTRSVTTGIKAMSGALAISLDGEREPIQTVIEFVPASSYEKTKDERFLDSNQRGNLNCLYLLAKEDPDIDNKLVEVVRSLGIYNQNRNKSVEKEVSEYLNGQFQRAETLGNELEAALKKQLAGGSFIFRGRLVAVGVLHADLLQATGKQLETAAKEVFEKYAEAPVQAEAGLAEKFINTSNLAQIATKDDPLALVKKSGGKSAVDTSQRALVSIKDYLEKHGQVEGRKVLDDFFSAPYGWSKDTTRYLIAGLLIAGDIKLRIAGADVTVRGDAATEALKNNNSFNKIGVALRDSRPSPEAKARAAERLLSLTGDTVLPLEDDISKAVIKCFPQLQRDYAALAMQLKTFSLPGVERAENIQDSITEILRGDASDSTSWLGGETCPLADDLEWARKVKKSLDNGIDTVIEQLRTCISEITGMPGVGIPGKLTTDTAPIRDEAKEFLKRENFYEYMPDLKARLTGLETAIRTAAQGMSTELDMRLTSEINTIQASPEWGRLGLDDQTQFSHRLDRLRITVTPDLAGLKKLLGHQYVLTSELEHIKAAIKECAKPKSQPETGKLEESYDVTLTMPAELTSLDQADALIAEIEKLKPKFQQYVKIRITWKG
jgi:hypothetical protein